MKNIIFLAFCSLIFAGCTSIAYQIKTKEVYIPVKCNLKLPLKPQNNGTFEAHKELVIYYLKVEQIAKDCTKE